MWVLVALPAIIVRKPGNGLGKRSGGWQKARPDSVASEFTLSLLFLSSLWPIIARNLFDREWADFGESRQWQTGFIGGIIAGDGIFLSDYRRDLGLEAGAFLQQADRIVPSVTDG